MENSGRCEKIMAHKMGQQKCGGAPNDLLHTDKSSIFYHTFEPEPISGEASRSVDRYFRGDGVEEKVTHQPVTFAAGGAATGEQPSELIVGEPCPLCERKYLGKMGPGDYSCVTCGMGMEEPCEHWKNLIANVAARPVSGTEPPTCFCKSEIGDNPNCPLMTEATQEAIRFLRWSAMDGRNTNTEQAGKIADGLAAAASPQAPAPPQCKGCVSGSLESFEHDGCLTDKTLGKELGRWQQAIYELCRKHAIAPDCIDGGGTDSGDPLDFTLSEIGQVICQLENPQDYGGASLELERIAREIADALLAMPFTLDSLGRKHKDHWYSTILAVLSRSLEGRGGELDAGDAKNFLGPQVALKLNGDKSSDELLLHAAENALSAAKKWWAKERDGFVIGFSGTGLATQAEYAIPSALAAFSLSRDGELDAKPTCCGNPFQSTTCGNCGLPDQYSAPKPAQINDSVRNDK